MSLVGNVGEDGHRMGSDRGGGLHPSLYFYSLTLTKSESLVDLTGKTKRCSVNLVSSSGEQKNYLAIGGIFSCMCEQET